MEDFERAYQDGRRLVNPLFVAFVRPTKEGLLRGGFVASRRVGGAVERNRAKRLLREAFRSARPKGLVSADVVLVARKAMNEARYPDVERAYLRGVGRWFEKTASSPG